MTRAEALQVLADIRPPDRGDFVQSLLNQYGKRGTLSEKQWHWVEKIAEERINPKPRNTVTVDGAKLHALLDKAGEKLKYPKIRVTVDGNELKIQRTGPRSKRPGVIRLTDGGSYPDNKWYGDISADGKEFAEGRHFANWVVDWLRDFLCDPAGKALEYGRLTGACMFCGRELSDDRSKAAGYGPICADHWGLPWGERVTDEQIVQEEETVEPF